MCSSNFLDKLCINCNKTQPTKATHTTACQFVLDLLLVLPAQSIKAVNIGLVLHTRSSPKAVEMKPVWNLIIKQNDSRCFVHLGGSDDFQTINYTNYGFTSRHKHLSSVLIIHTHRQPFNGLLSGTTQVGWYQKKHSPTHTHPDHQTSFISFLHLLKSDTI